MTFDWYNIFNLTDWLATGLVARTLTLSLESRGRTVFQITQGNETSVGYDDVFLPVNLLEINPYSQGNYAVYLDSDNGVWFGFLVS